MLSGVPNFAFAIGYTNSSWTLKVDLVCEHLCRLLAHMDAHRLRHVRARSPTTDDRAPAAAGLPGRLRAARDRRVPQAGLARRRGQLEMSYAADRERLREGPVEDRRCASRPPESGGGSGGRVCDRLAQLVGVEVVDAEHVDVPEAHDALLVDDEDRAPRPHERRA